MMDFCRSYDIMWQDSMADLNEQLHVEGIDQEAEVPGQKSVRSLSELNVDFSNHPIPFAFRKHVM